MGLEKWCFIMTLWWRKKWRPLDNDVETHWGKIWKNWSIPIMLSRNFWRASLRKDELKREREGRWRWWNNWKALQRTRKMGLRNRRQKYRERVKLRSNRLYRKSMLRKARQLHRSRLRESGKDTRLVQRRVQMKTLLHIRVNHRIAVKNDFIKEFNKIIR